MSNETKVKNVEEPDKKSAKAINKLAVHELHYAIAENGKVLALRHKHNEALEHYREAIRMAVSIKAPEIFFRHYTQCVLESLELTASYAEVIEYCVNADAHYQKIEAKIPLHLKDHASTLERQGVNELKAGQDSTALTTLTRVLDLTGDSVMPLTEELVAWLKRGLRVDKNRIVALQKKHKYFVVRADQVDASKAKSLESVKGIGAGKRTQVNTSIGAIPI